MNVLEQVEYETGMRKRYAAITFFAAVLIVIAQLIQLSGVKADVTELTLNLVVANIRAGRDIAAAVLEGLGYVAVGFMLIWMQGIARARNPEMRSFVRYFSISGAALASVLTVAATVSLAITAHQFVSSGDQSYPQANHLTSGAGLVLLSLLAELGALLLAIGFVLTALNMMRVGLLTRWLGYTGVIAGALVIFPIGGIAPVIQGLWLAAVAVLFFGRWPSGDPPAWASGVAMPWQPAQQTTANARVRREQRPRQQRRRGRMDELPTIVEPERSPDAASESSNGSGPRQPQKRKRKRRS